MSYSPVDIAKIYVKAISLALRHQNAEDLLKEAGDKIIEWFKETIEEGDWDEYQYPDIIVKEFLEDLDDPELVYYEELSEIFIKWLKKKLRTLLDTLLSS